MCIRDSLERRAGSLRRLRRRPRSRSSSVARRTSRERTPTRSPSRSKELTHRNFDADPNDFSHALDFKYFRPGKYSRGELKGHDGFYFKRHGT
eukprot:14741587-Alexandrium_andersonii.AAC.1